MSLEGITGRMKSLEDRTNNFEESQEQVQKELTDVKQTIDDHEERITNLEENSINSKTEVDSSYFYTPGRAKHFKGREAELQFLKSNLSPTSRGCNMISICGVGGNGKSTLAAEFCFREKADYPGGVFWFTVDDNSYLEASVNKLAFKTGVCMENFEEKLHHILSWLGERKMPWILILDNLDELELDNSMNTIINGSWKTRVYSTGNIIITSRRKVEEMLETVDDLRVNNCLHLNCLNVPDGMSFLVERTGRHGEVEGAQQLVEELGGLPLALEQAASHIRSVNVSFSSYLKQYRQQKMKLLNRKKVKPIGQLPAEKLAVISTWIINFEYVKQLSSEYGYGKAAAIVMQVAGYLGPDDIPIEVINKGDPLLDLKDLPNCLDNELGQKEIMEILTKFSLFQCSNDDSECVLSVHRLVQEVIRTHISENADAECMLKSVLVDAIRLVNGAFKHVTTPKIILEGKPDSLLNLHRWSQVANHCNHLLEHIGRQLKQFPHLEEHITIRKEFVDILQSLKVYHSICGRQRMAIYCQDHLLQIVPRLTSSEDEINYLVSNKSIKFPLDERQQNLLISKMSKVNQIPQEIPIEKKNKEAVRLKEEGNRAYKEKHYDVAVEVYTQALDLATTEEIKRDLYQNRSLCFYLQKVYMKSLRDANLCIKSAYVLGTADLKLAKAYRRRAYAWLAMYKDYQETRKEVEICNAMVGEELFVKYGDVFGNINAALATYFHPSFAAELSKFFELYKVRILDPTSGGELFGVLTCHKFLKMETVYILKEGTYSIKWPDHLRGSLPLLLGSLSLVGFPGEKVNVKIEDHALLVDVSYFQNIKLEVNNKYVRIGTQNENIKLEANNKLVQVGPQNNSRSGSVVLQSCQITGGKCSKDYDHHSCPCGKSCSNILQCTAYKEDISAYFKARQQIIEQKGSLNEIHTNPKYKGIGKVMSDFMMKRSSRQIVESYPPILLSVGNMLCQHCDIKRGPSSGPIASGESSYLFIEECKISSFQLSGVQVEKEGSLVITKSKIFSNGHHGVLARQDALLVRIEDNEIFSNHHQGTFCTNQHCTNNTLFTVKGNIIHHNDIGIASAFVKTLSILNNAIFSNNMWGVMLQYPQVCSISQNDIHQNLCGGVRVVWNNSKNVIVAENDIHDHNGPAFIATPVLNAIEYTDPMFDQGKDITPVYMINNSFSRNDVIHQKFSDYGLSLSGSCNFCSKRDIALKYCGKCSKTCYCSKECQLSDWKLRHKAFCKVYCGVFEFKVDFPRTISVTVPFMFHPELQGIGEGPKPDIKGKTKFLLKLQAGDESIDSSVNLEPELPTVSIYDQSLTVSGLIMSSELFTFVRQCGVLCASKFYGKKLYCWAKIRERDYQKLIVYLDRVAEPQSW